VAYGDSITKGYGDDFALDDISQDGRDTGGGFEPVLNDLLTVRTGIPHRIANEGYGGRTSSYGLSKLAAVLASHPEAESFLVQWGTNDGDPFFAVPSGLGLRPGQSGYEGSFKDNMQQIIDVINTAGKEVCLAKLPIVLGDNATGAQYPDPENPPLLSRGAFVIEYNLVIDELKNIPSNNINVAVPDFWALFSEDIGGGKRYETEYYDNFHPNGTGYRSMANRWFEVLTP
jgi:lysophospholipase L1-like esterase